MKFWLYVANAVLYVYAKSLNVFLWTMSKFLKKERFLDFLMGLAQIYANIGRMIMIRAVGFAMKHNIEVNNDTPVPDDEGPPLNVPPAQVAGGFKNEAGQTIPLCFDPLPDWVVFEALFNQKYGRHGKCPLILQGKPNLLSCEDLYELLITIHTDPAATPKMKELYGTIMSVIVMRYGVDLNPKQLN